MAQPLAANPGAEPSPAPTLSPAAVARMDARAQAVREYAARFNNYAAGRMCSFNDPEFREAEFQRAKAELDAIFGRAPALIARAA